MAWLVLLASSRPVSLRPFPRNVAVGDTAVLEGELVAGLDEPRLVVTGPDGSERERPVPGTAASGPPLTFDAPGRWLVEVFGRGPNGSTLVALLDVSAGPAPPAPARSGRGRARPGRSRPPPRRCVLAHLNATRRRHGPPAAPALTGPPGGGPRPQRRDDARRACCPRRLPGSGTSSRGCNAPASPSSKALQNIAQGESALAAHEAIEDNPAQLRQPAGRRPHPGRRGHRARHAARGRAGGLPDRGARRAAAAEPGRSPDRAARRLR